MTIAPYDALILAAGSLLFGLVLLLRASASLVASSSFVARRFGLSEFFIGATVVAFGTSAPELFISLNANLAGNPGVAIGNIVGSNIVNVLVILGLTALVFPLVFRQTMLLRDVTVLVISSAVLSVLILWGEFGFWSGLAMLIAMAFYVAWQFFEDRPDEDIRAFREIDLKQSVGKHLLVIAMSLAVLVVGTEFLVRGAVSGGVALGIPQTFIALTVVAAGTSFPELATSFYAAMRGKGDMAIGNIVGSNVFNILAILGLTSLVSTVHAVGTVNGVDLVMFIGSSTALFAAVWLKGIPRWAGALLTAAYAVYVTMQYYVI
jgi:cation:H+ antiporter